MTEKPLTPGMAHAGTQTITQDLTAPHFGSGSLPVYATPAMVALVERVCHQLAEAHLPAGQTTVGVGIRLRHLAPTPPGAVVRVHAEVVAVEGNLITFAADVWDETEWIGEAEHRRAVIEVDRFLRRVEMKAKGGY